tara:strand:- start:560 stop:1090 length:531 start_codon:yes stop_codon:yes gene_type:complete
MAQPGNKGSKKTIDFLTTKNRNFNNILQSYLSLTDGGTVDSAVTLTASPTLSAGASSVGNLTFSTGSVGIVHTTTAAASADAATYTVHGKRFEVRNQLQAAINDDETSAPFVVTNASIASDSIVVGGLSGVIAGGLSESVMHAVVSGSNTMRFMFTNAGGVAVADNMTFTASFVVL